MVYLVMFKCLELFSGNGDISKSVKELGGISYRVDWSNKVDAELHCDIGSMTVRDVLNLCGGIPNAIWASPQCTTYSIATARHRTLKESLIPKTELAKQDDLVNKHMWRLIDDLVNLGTKYYFVENPKGRMRHMDFVKGRPKHTITYCSYGNVGDVKGYEHLHVMKATDIWTNHPNPNFLPPCKKPYPHEHGNMGKIKKRNYLSRGAIPKDLTDHIAKIMMD